MTGADQIVSVAVIVVGSLAHLAGLIILRRQPKENDE